jgi:hypothetical protein
VLVAAQPSAQAQHPAGLGQGLVQVGDRTQHQAGHHHVDGAVGDGQGLGGASHAGEDGMADGLGWVRVGMGIVLTYWVMRVS